MFTIVEIYQEADAINHHGSERKVDDKKKKNGFMLPQTNLGHIAKFFGRYFFISQNIS